MDIVFECPICFCHYADAEPTTLPCGHSCCLTDGKAIDICHICRAAIPNPSALLPNYTLRDAAVMSRRSRGSEEALAASVKKPMPSEVAAGGLGANVNNTAKIDQSKKKKKKNKKKNAEESVPCVVTDDAHLESESSDDGEEELALPLNPSLLPEYPILITSTASSESVSNIELVFRQSMSFGEKLTCAIAQAVTWKDALLSIAQEYSADKSATRFIMQNNFEGPDGTQLLAIDILAVKESPLRLIDKSWMTKDWLGKPVESDDVKRFPLIVVRYSYIEKTMSRQVQEFRRDTQAMYDSGVIVFNFKYTPADIATGHAYLREKEALLSPDYVRDFRRDNKDFYKPSFIVPLPQGMVFLKTKEGLCTLTGCDKPGWAVRTL